MLWITSQDDKCLINAREITVEGKKIKGVMGFSVTQWSKNLGKYESNERAIEILNEIFMKIEESNGFSVTYTMPKK